VLEKSLPNYTNSCQFFFYFSIFINSLMNYPKHLNTSDNHTLVRRCIEEWHLRISTDNQYFQSKYATLKLLSEFLYDGSCNMHNTLLKGSIVTRPQYMGTAATETVGTFSFVEETLTKNKRSRHTHNIHNRTQHLQPKTKHKHNHRFYR